jgi:glycerol-3-phosphate dehydrogenase
MMAEQTIDRVLDHTKAAARDCTTATTPLLPDEAQPKFSGILPPQVSREAVEHFCRGEWAIHLDDVMIRRTSWRYYHREHLAIARDVAGQMHQLLGWSSEQTEEELARYSALTAAAGGSCEDRAAPQSSVAHEQMQSA